MTGRSGRHPLCRSRSHQTLRSSDCWCRTQAATLARCVPNLVERQAPSAVIALIAPSCACIATGRSTHPRSSGRRFGIAQSRESGCRAPHDRFRNPGSTPRTIATATIRACGPDRRWPADLRFARLVGAIGTFEINGNHAQARRRWVPPPPDWERRGWDWRPVGRGTGPAALTSAIGGIGTLASGRGP
jgi:hypothetical protein